MRFSIGGSFAQCTACHADEFYPALRITPERRDIFHCAACGSEALYSELVANLTRSLRQGSAGAGRQEGEKESRRSANPDRGGGGARPTERREDC